MTITDTQTPEQIATDQITETAKSVIVQMLTTNTAQKPQADPVLFTWYCIMGYQAVSAMELMRICGEMTPEQLNSMVDFFADAMDTVVSNLMDDDELLAVFYE